MNITLLTYGSRGDFQPFLALAVGLRKAGHSVRLAGPGRFADFSAQYAVPFAALAGDPEEISIRYNEAGTNPVRVVRSIRDYVFEIAPQVTRDARLAIEGADLVIHSFLFTTGGHTFARQMGIPDISVQTFPMFAPTRTFPNVAMGNIPPGLFSYFTHWLATQIFWYGGNTGNPRFSKQRPQDFPSKLYWPFRKVDERPLTPLVFAYSPTVLPRPEEWTSPHIHIPGYFFLDEPGYTPPPALADFLVAGEPPVCISFGSMVHQDVERISNAVLEALERIVQRGIILTGWGGWKARGASENLFYLDAAPHDWLFPRCSAIVHHGGAGTTAAGLRSGKPNIVIPFAGDQPFWGKRVAALGAGPHPIPVRRLDAAPLEDALHQSLVNEQMRERAAEVGEKIRAENGVERTVRLIEDWAENFRLL
jgi:UDP:flavonoid glycosyltransferase YjiC (YdhE family)